MNKQHKGLSTSRKKEVLQSFIHPQKNDIHAGIANRGSENIYDMFNKTISKAHNGLRSGPVGMLETYMEPMIKRKYSQV